MRGSRHPFFHETNGEGRTDPARFTKTPVSVGFVGATVMLTFAHQSNTRHRAEVSKTLPVCAAKASAAFLVGFTYILWSHT
jgi:hypothetical protein